MSRGDFSIQKGQNSVNTLIPQATNFVSAVVMGENDFRSFDLATLRETRPNIDTVHFSATAQFAIVIRKGSEGTNYIMNPNSYVIPSDVTAIEIYSTDPVIITTEFWSMNGQTGGLLRGGYSDGYSDGFDILHSDGGFI